jgi:hypothetical protein
MARWIERKNTPDGPRYREWSGGVDKYTTPELTREAMANLIRFFGDAEERLTRTDQQGTSLREGNHRMRDMNSDWETEKCDYCGAFHHTFQLRTADDLCSDCGEKTDDRSHRPPCARRIV